MEKASQQQVFIDQIGYEMLTLCVSQLQKANKALINQDSDLAEEVIRIESRVNALDIKIDRDCEKFLALYNPVASDLRFIMVIRKINSDLERIADHAYSICKYIEDIDKPMATRLIESLQFKEMSAILDDMLGCITFAYKEKDIDEARKVFKKDKKIDKIKLQSFAIIEKEIQKDNNLIHDSLVLFSIINKLERVGDLLKNISEELIFYIDAQVIRHKNKK